MKDHRLSADGLRAYVQQLPDNNLAATRAAALTRLVHDGLPGIDIEDWKYTNLDDAIDISNRFFAAQARDVDSDTLTKTIDTIVASIAADWLLVVNGNVDTSRFSDPSGIVVEKYSDSTAPAVFDRPLSDLNAALLHDGLRIRIDAATDSPIGILIIDEAGETVSAAQSNISIEVAAGCDAEVIEYQTSIGDSDHYQNSVMSLSLGEMANVAFVRIQDRARHHVQTGRLIVSTGKNSHFTQASFDLGGGLIRNDLEIDICEPGANVDFNGIYFADHKQHIDNHTRVDHRVGPAISSQEYRGILKDRSRAVWNGKAIVHKGADGTDANQANHNLLLSSHAEINAKPELEIYADDVKCSHGTTVGQLDEAALFYLRSRGLDKREATQMLVHAFARDLIGRTPIETCRDIIASLLENRLAEMTGGDVS